MEVKPGYKLTDIGVFPVDWEVNSLLCVFQPKQGLQFPVEQQHTVQKVGFIKFIRIIDVTQSNEDPRYVVDPGHQHQIHEEDIFMVRYGSPGLLGIGYCGVIANNMFRLIPRQPMNRLFFYYLLQSKQAQIIQLSSSTTMAAVNFSSLRSLIVGYPCSLQEQDAIATILSNIDSLITSLEKLIEKKKNIKQGVMQELLTGKRRLPGFTGEWETTNIDTCFNVLKGKGLSKSQLSSSGQHMCILYGELFTTYTDIIEIVVSSTNSNEGIDSVAGDILLPGSTTTTGIDLAKASALMMDDVRLGGDINILRPTRKIDSSFLAMYLNTVRRNKIAEKTKGITIHHLHGNDLKDVLIELPPLMEQISISSAIITINKEVRSLENLLSKYKLIKDGMMQELLTGRIRLV